jgi:hypothetical protein
MRQNLPIAAINDAEIQKRQEDLLQEICEKNDLNKITEDALSVEDILWMMMDKGTLSPMQVQLPKDLKQEADGGLILADMKGPFNWTSQTISQSINIDCTGYQSVLVHKVTAGIITPTISNDGQNWAGTLCVNMASSTAVAATMPAAVGIYVIPVTSKWIRLTGPASSVSCVIYLSQTAYNPLSGIINPPVNLTQIAGTTILTGGIAGSQAVGGNVATGIAPTSNPIQIGGVDALATPLTRRALVDQLGRLQIGNVPSQRASGINVLRFDPAYRNVLDVQDTTLIEGEMWTDLFPKILMELKILNQQIYELPRILQQTGQSMDSPEDLRNDNSIFQ